jgi:thiol-disulfide isomerase/thioredoxin
MKTLTTLVLGLIISTGLFAQGIQFEHSSFEEALAKAKAENKLIFMDCYTEWCGPCKYLSKNVFPLKEVGDFYNANFVNLKMDMEKGEGPALLKRYGVKGFPTLLFLDHKGNVLYTKVGGGDAAALIAEAKLALDPNERIDVVASKYKNGDRSPEVITKYVALLSKSFKKEEAKKIGAEYISGLSNEDLLKKENFNTFKIVGAEYGGKKYQFVKENKDQFIALSDEQSVDRFLLMTHYDFLNGVAMESDTKKLDQLVADFEKEYNNPQTISMTDRLYNTHYLANNQYKKWFDFTDQNIEKAKSQGSDKCIRTSLNSVYTVISDPRFAKVEGAYDKAKSWIEVVFELDKESLGAYYCLAMLNQKAGNKQEALKNVNLCIEKGIAKDGKADAKAVQLKKQIEAM